MVTITSQHLNSNTQNAWESGSIENCNFKIISQNVRGLRTNKVKRKTVFEYLKEKGDIAFLQETHCTTEIEKSWNDECGCDTYFSNGTSSSRGVMIMISKKLDIDVTEQIKDSDGRFLMLKCIIQGTKIVIYNVYAPNNKNEHLTFMNDIKTQLNSLENDTYEYMVGGGDWNFTYEKIDRSGGNYDRWENSINEIHEIKEKFDLIDIWRVKNPEKVRYTWRRKRPLIQSRLDRFYISDTMQYNISQADILPGILSDHSAIILSIKPTKSISQNGPNFWKFNNSLLKNENFAKGLTTFIENDLKKECENIKCKQVKWKYSKYKINPCKSKGKTRPLSPRGGSK